MKHIVNNQHEHNPWFVLLHGTGANERDLIPLATMIDESANYIGVLGEVRENGMARFFKRYPNGEFDIADLEFRTTQLHEFLSDFFKEHDIKKQQVVLLGYSNGANTAQSLLLHYPDDYAYGILLHPKNVKEDVPFKTNNQTHVFIGAGLYDPICPKVETDRLKQRLNEADIQTTVVIEPTDHTLTHHEIMEAKKWYESLGL